MNKTLKKITNIPIVILSSAAVLFLLFLFFGEKLEWQYILWRDKKNNEKEQKEFDRKLTEFRKKETPQFKKLMEEYKYYAGMNNYHNLNSLYEVSIEDGIPVVNGIDFYNGEKVVFFTQKLTGYSDELLPLGNDVYYYSGKFYNGNYGFILCTAKRDEYSIYVNVDNAAYPFEKDLDKTLALLSSRITKTQLQYTGVYDFERLETIKDYGNKEDYEEFFRDQIKTAKEISVICTGIGNLYAKPVYNTKEDDDNDNEGWTFFIDENDENNADIISSVGDGHIGSFETRCYFLGDYIIYYSNSSAGYFEGGDGYTSVYKVYFKKRANGK
jgi:hypothetical protein